MMGHKPYPSTENRQVVQSGRELEIIEITTGASAKQVVFSDNVKEIWLYNNDATNDVNLLATSGGTVGFLLVHQAASLHINLSGKSLNLWLKSVAGTPTVSILGIR